MGWDYFTDGRGPAKVRAYLLEEAQKGDRLLLAHAGTAGVLWTVQEYTHPIDGKRLRFIGCDLIEGSGYKHLCEAMHPYNYDCPLRFLDMAPEENAEWRAGVREHHAQKKRIKAALQVGNTLTLLNATIPHATLVSVKPIIGEYEGRRYRIPRRLITV